MPNADAHTAVEIREIVLKSYQQVLDLEQIAPEDDFFDRGGDSVKGVALLHQLRDITGVRVPIATLFMRRTPEEIADEIIVSLSE
jgi:nonribosomal peptide synthetase MxcG